MEQYQPLLTFEENTEGSDYVIGDIHGHFKRLRQQLVAMEFDITRDRLFSVGDLVDRGPESDQVLHWLKKDWFFAVVGNHDDLAISVAMDYYPVDLDLYVRQGGRWLIEMPVEQRKKYGEALEKLPLAMCIKVPKNRRIGIVHAQVPGNDWAVFEGNGITPNQEEQALWGRSKIRNQDPTVVKNIDHVYVGHSIVPKGTTLGNVTYIENGGWTKRRGVFTIVKIN